jgi:hypothetical protein
MIRQPVRIWRRPNKKAFVSEGLDDKQVLDLIGCGGKI